MQIYEKGGLWFLGGLGVKEAESQLIRLRIRTGSGLHTEEKLLPKHLNIQAT